MWENRLPNSHHAGKVGQRNRGKLSVGLQRGAILTCGCYPVLGRYHV